MAKRFKMVNGDEVELSTEENKVRDAEEKAWADGEKDRNLDAIRDVRKPLLIECDWEINKLEDAGGDASKWRAYRIELRDVTKTLDTVEKTRTKLEQDSHGSYKNFPTKPSS
tara:strand:- start:110 stop:445 length:336 start_codon:yes stop_codon:yes gene_type:complete